MKKIILIVIMGMFGFCGIYGQNLHILRNGYGWMMFSLDDNLFDLNLIGNPDVKVSEERDNVVYVEKCYLFDFRKKMGNLEIEYDDDMLIKRLKYEIDCSEAKKYFSDEFDKMFSIERIGKNKWRNDRNNSYIEIKGEGKIIIDCKYG